MEGIRSWAINVIGTALALTVADMLLPEGTTRKYAKLVFSLVLMLVVVTPVVSILVGKDFKVSDFLGKQPMGNVGEYSKNTKDNYYSSVLAEYESKLNAYIVKKVNDSGAVCKNVRLTIKKDPDKEDFGMVEAIDIEISSGFPGDISTKLAQEFKLDTSKVIVRVVN